MHLELIVIAEALSYINSLDGDRFVIFCDSKSALLHLIHSNLSVRGLPLAYSNEEADRLANEAGSDGDLYTCAPWHTELLPLVRESCYKVWSEYFVKREGGMNRHEIVTALGLRFGQMPLNRFGFLMRRIESPNCAVCAVIEDVRRRRGSFREIRFLILIFILASPLVFIHRLRLDLCFI
uniref:SFRICE_030881 n=1 Tax=Spodoptera frugiperda TaxID=7108 RepID=A0A2H1VJ28_SPOFR